MAPPALGMPDDGSRARSAIASVTLDAGVGVPGWVKTAGIGAAVTIIFSLFWLMNREQSSQVRESLNESRTLSREMIADLKTELRDERHSFMDDAKSSRDQNAKQWEEVKKLGEEVKKGTAQNAETQKDVKELISEVKKIKVKDQP